MRPAASASKGWTPAMGLWACGFLLALSIHSLTAPCEGVAGEEAPSLSKEEAAVLLRQVFKKREVAVLRVGRGPIEGLWEIILKTESGTGILYVDRSRQYFFGGPILAIRDLKNLTEESLVAFAGPEPNPAGIPLEDALVLGDAGAEKKVIVFLNPECRHCGEMLAIMEDISSQRKDIVFYLKMLPGGPGDDSYWKAESIVSRGSLELLEASLAGESIPRPEHPVPQVAESLEIADRFGVQATPSLILADGTLVEGILSRDNLLRWIDTGGKHPNAGSRPQTNK